MHYFIDGYNLLFFLSSLETNVQQKRQEIIRELSEKIYLLKFDATIVFDSTSQMGEATRSSVKNLEIIFTSFGETADAFIIKEIEHAADPTQEIVVTSDKALGLRVKQEQANLLGVKEFLKLLHKRVRNKNREKKQKHLQSVEIQGINPLTSFDRYLKIFEERSQTSEADNQNKTIPIEKSDSLHIFKIKEPLGEERKEEPISEYERWLSIFEKRYRDEK